MLFFTIVTLLASFTTATLSIGYGGYLSPLHGMNHPEKYSDQYIVLFHKNHTLEQHFIQMDRNLTTLPDFEAFSFGYQVTMDDTTRDEYVRRDPGVQMVETTFPIYAVEGIFEVVEGFEWYEAPEVCLPRPEYDFLHLVDDLRQQDACPSSSWVLQRAFRGSAC